MDFFDVGSVENDSVDVNFGIRNARVKSEPVVIIERVHLSQLKIIHELGVYTFNKYIIGIRHAPPISVYAIRVYEQRFNNGFLCENVNYDIVSF